MGQIKSYKIIQNAELQINSGFKSPEGFSTNFDLLEKKSDGSLYKSYNLDKTPNIDVHNQIIKPSKKEQLDNLIVTITSGKVFYADPNSRTDLVDVVMEGMLNNMPDDYQTEWKTVSRGADPFELVTFAELKEAKRKALEAKASIIGVV